MIDPDDPYADVKQHTATADMMLERKVVRVPTKIQKRRRTFIMVPWSWAECLRGAAGKTYQVALYLLHQHWREHGGPVKLPNGMLELDGVSRQSKWRALADLEHRGLIKIERRFKKSPMIWLKMPRV